MIAFLRGSNERFDNRAVKEVSKRKRRGLREKHGVNRAVWEGSSAFKCES